jgi:formamidopyrimidine-DNA glycosylase
MPELPDITVYVEQIARRIVGSKLERVTVLSPNLLRTVDPPLDTAPGRTVLGVSRLGKRIVVALDGDLNLVLHLMISGRLHWKPPGAKLGRKMGLALFEFPNGTLTWTEASTRKRASLHVVAGAAGLALLDPGGIEPLTATAPEFAAALTRERHTLKRALTDPRVLSGVGNAYSDEILHRARLSPFRLSTQLDPAEIETLRVATRDVLIEWTERLRAETGDRFPEHVTAFREGMAVHGRYRKPCPVCGAPVQRVAYADNELNYCARCQTGGRLLADRAFSRLLREDWPKTLEELEEQTAARRAPREAP